MLPKLWPFYKFPLVFLPLCPEQLRSQSFLPQCSDSADRFLETILSRLFTFFLSCFFVLSPWCQTFSSWFLRFLFFSCAFFFFGILAVQSCVFCFLSPWSTSTFFLFILFMSFQTLKGKSRSSRRWPTIFLFSHLFSIPDVSSL